MSGKDYELERLRNEMDAAQQAIDNAKYRLDPIRSKRDIIKQEIGAVNYRIADIKRSIDEEYRMMKVCYQNKDRYSAENHKYRAQSFKDQLQREYSYKNDYFSQLDYLKTDYESAMEMLRNAKARKQSAKEAFNVRLNALKAAKEQERANWKTKICKCCGTEFSYRLDWNRIPDLCKPCQERAKQKWHETTCKKCGKTIRYHEDWEHIPKLCKECKQGR